MTTIAFTDIANFGSRSHLLCMLVCSRNANALLGFSGNLPLMQYLAASSHFLQSAFSSGPCSALTLHVTNISDTQAVEQAHKLEHHICCECVNGRRLLFPYDKIWAAGREDREEDGCRLCGCRAPRIQLLLPPRHGPNQACVSPSIHKQYATQADRLILAMCHNG